MLQQNVRKKTQQRRSMDAQAKGEGRQKKGARIIQMFTHFAMWQLSHTYALTSKNIATVRSLLHLLLFTLINLKKTAIL